MYYIHALPVVLPVASEHELTLVTSFCFLISGPQEPIQIELGTSFHYKASGFKRLLVEKTDSFQYVPLLQNLEWILQNKEVSDEVSTWLYLSILYFIPKILLQAYSVRVLYVYNDTDHIWTLLYSYTNDL